jgi:CheY-like chemotaxis protein
MPVEHRREDPRCLHGQRPIWCSGKPPTLVFTQSGGRWPGALLWGLAPMARHEHPCNRAGVIAPRFLIVDDNTSFREEMRALLVEQGLDVVGGAGSAADAHRQIAELRPDLALIDIDLGAESGLELARQLREEPRDGAAPHVILISTHDEAIGFLAKSDLSAASIRRMLAPIEGGDTDEP